MSLAFLEAKYMQESCFKLDPEMTIYVTFSTVLA